MSGGYIIEIYIYIYVYIWRCFSFCTFTIRAISPSQWVAIPLQAASRGEGGGTQLPIRGIFRDLNLNNFLRAFCQIILKSFRNWILRPGRHFRKFYQSCRREIYPTHRPSKYSTNPSSIYKYATETPPLVLEILFYAKYFGFVLFHFVSVNFLSADSAILDNLCAICDCRV